MRRIRPMTSADGLFAAFAALMVIMLVGLDRFV
jgi:hypothetical protein